MNRFLYITTLGLAMAPVFEGCATKGSMANVDPLRKKVELQSTDDRRSSMPNPRTESGVTKTISELKASVQKDPRRIDSWLNLAQLYLMQGQFKASEEACRKALRIDLKNEEAKKIMAQIYFRRGNNEMAAIILNGLGGMRSKDSTVLNLLGMISIRENHNAEAMEYFKTALTINPNDIAVRMNLGVLYVRYRQLANASVEFERVLKIMPDHNDAKLHLAIIKTSRGDYKVAEEIYGDILDRRKNNPLALYNLAVLEKNKKNYSNAIDVLKKYLATAQARKSKNTEVYALIEDIRKRQQAANQHVVSDDEIQAMADKDVASATKDDSSDNESAATAPQSEPTPAAATKGSKASRGGEEEISDLEKLLQ